MEPREALPLLLGPGSRSQNQYELSAATSVMMSSVLEDALLQLSIIHGVSASEHEEPVLSRKPTRSKTLQREHERERHAKGAYARKVQRECHSLMDTFERTRTELTRSQQFETLVDYVECERRTQDLLSTTLASECDTALEIERLKCEISRVETEGKERLKELEQRVAEQRGRVRSSRVASEAGARRECALRASALEGFEWAVQEQERVLEEQRAEWEQRERVEGRVQLEMERFLTMRTAQLEREVEQWADKFETDFEAKSRELEALKNGRTRDLSRCDELTKQYCAMESVVLDERRVKEEAEAKAKEALRQYSAALLIQCWWRGEMVRRGLPKKKKKKKKGKKGKKGKPNSKVRKRK